MTIDKPWTYSVWRYIKKHNLDFSDIIWHHPNITTQGYIWAPYIPMATIDPIIDELLPPIQPLRNRYPAVPLIASDLVSVQPLSMPSMLPLWMIDMNFLDDNKWELKKPETFKSWRRTKEIMSRYSIKSVNPDYYGIINVVPE